MLQLIIGYFMILTAVGGSSLASYFDLKTTEIPDEIPLAMVVLGLLTRFGYALFTGNWNFLLIPALIGGGFFLFGLLMYYTGQWGGGDAKLLGAIGILMGTLPEGIATVSALPLFIDIILNIFLVGAVYIIVYAFVMALRNKKITKGFFKSIKGDVNEFIIFIFVIIVIIGANALIFWKTFGVLNVWLAVAIGTSGTGFYFLWKFLRCVERIGFTKKVMVKDLMEGDMLGEDIKKLNLNKKIIRGLTKEEVKKIKRIKKTVWIREGVRFGPVFPISVIVTLLFGNLLMFIL
ncbi:MAG: prepilin peptidase [Candidatus Aenigmarchaeota archaeon]|nr:prepilin peptidase [Candidatus Aenigmarchaeota archaeon]